MHGVAWSEAMDDLMEAIENDDEDKISEIVSKFDDIISQCNPIEDPMAKDHKYKRAPRKPQPPPMRKELQDILDDQGDTNED